METLLKQQEEGKILKEYSALTVKVNLELPGFPKEKPVSWIFEDKKEACSEITGFGTGSSVEIKSAFRPFGPGRKSVRPVLFLNSKDKKEVKEYVTEILEYNSISDEGKQNLSSIKIKISKGFRHQIRCHLSWLDMPIINDSLYSGLNYGRGMLGLRACSLLFTDPSSGREKNYSIPPLALDEL
jgi:23S rRNA pseudouridine1911/1915/1917 synthase